MRKETKVDFPLLSSGKPIVEQRAPVGALTIRCYFKYQVSPLIQWATMLLSLGTVKTDVFCRAASHMSCSEQGFTLLRYPCYLILVSGSTSGPLTRPKPIRNVSAAPCIYGKLSMFARISKNSALLPLGDASTASVPCRYIP